MDVINVDKGPMRLCEEICNKKERLLRITALYENVGCRLIFIKPDEFYHV